MSSSTSLCDRKDKEGQIVQLKLESILNIMTVLISQMFPNDLAGLQVDVF